MSITSIVSGSSIYFMQIFYFISFDNSFLLYKTTLTTFHRLILSMSSVTDKKTNSAVSKTLKKICSDSVLSLKNLRKIWKGINISFPYCTLTLTYWKSLVKVKSLKFLTSSRNFTTQKCNSLRSLFLPIECYFLI